MFMGVAWLRTLFKWELQKNEDIDTTWLFPMAQSAGCGTGKGQGAIRKPYQV